MIENDLDDRPQYTPWIAALWVEPDMRRRGIAAKLMELPENRLRRGDMHFAISVQRLTTHLITLLVASSKSKARYPD
ncbi:GNAT family N-acetyltransferase [Sinorhizobium meliloti]|uniref:GNAT family N-acetyltransferase n=1 Tax=Rhizobium meliloti TaxID=382 RepID=UPI001F3044AF|nr:GNAT family N-acetyltransferase [Sinorhizobium meliloti]